MKAEMELREYRRITSEALGIVNPTPKDLECAMKWRSGIIDVMLDVLILERNSKKQWFKRLKEACNAR
jgi:hypothetical protein